LAAAALIALGSPAGALSDCATCKTTSLLLPLSGRIFLPIAPIDPCAPAGDSITIDGEAHVVTTVRQNFLTDIHLNMAGVEGLGQRTGNRYIGTGTNKLVNFAPIEPCSPVQSSFRLERTDGCADIPLPLKFSLCFAQDGTLLPQSTVSVVGGD
jgi:hypothetical protein